MPGTSDTFTTSNRLDKQPTGGNYNLWGSYLNTNFDLIDAMKDGNVIITMSTTQHTLTTNTAATDEARMGSITLIGSMGGTGTITAPNVQKLTWVENLTTDGFPIVWTNGTGTSTSIVNNGAALIQCDASGNMRILGGNATLSGTAYLQKGLQTIFIPASAFEPTTTNGGTQTTIMCTTSSRMVKAMVFGSATSQYASFTIEGMPKSWDGGSIRVKFHGFTTGTTGTQVFEMNMGFAQSYAGVSLDRPYNYSTAALGTEASTATFDIVTGTITGSISGGTASQGASLSMMVRRNTTSTNQTLAGNYFMIGATVVYNNTLPNDN